MQMYINKNGQQLGPFEETKVLEMLRSGQLSESDFGIKQGNQNWQKLGEMFPQKPISAWVPPAAQPNIHTPAVRKSGPSKGAIFGLLGCGGLLLLSFVGLLAVFLIPGKKTTTEIANSNSSKAENAPSPSPSPTFDSKKYGEMLEKREELFKLSPPEKLSTNPLIKSKVLMIEKLNAEKDAISSFPASYKYDEYGIKSPQIASTLDEIQTLIQIKCSQGKEIGKYGPRMAYYVAYSSVCSVGIIDYKAKQMIGKKTFVNAKRPKTIPDNGMDYINESPVDEIDKYLKGLVKE